MFGAMGLAFIVFGLITDGLTGFLSVMGLLFLIGAIFSFISARKYKK